MWAMASSEIIRVPVKMAEDVNTVLTSSHDHFKITMKL